MNGGRKRPSDYARDLDFHLANAAECARLIGRSNAPAEVLDSAKRIRQGSRALRGMARQIQEGLRGK